MHRFIWNLHYPLPEGMSRSHYLTEGPWAVPGNYSVKLIVNGQTTTQRLLIKPNPRSKTPAAALQQEFSLASRLIEKLAQATKALEQAKDLRKQIDQVKKDAARYRELRNVFEARRT